MSTKSCSGPLRSRFSGLRDAGTPHSNHYSQENTNRKSNLIRIAPHKLVVLAMLGAMLSLTDAVFADR